METVRKRKSETAVSSKKIPKYLKNVVAEALAVAEKQPELITKGALIKQQGVGKRKRFIIEVKEPNDTVKPAIVEKLPGSWESWQRVRKLAMRKELFLLGTR